MNIYAFFCLFAICIPSYLFAEDVEDIEGVEDVVIPVSEPVIALDPELILEGATEPPLIVFDQIDGHELVLSGEMEAALEDYNPQFKAWETSDYAKTIVESLQFDSKYSAPFAFIVDLNKDEKRDVIIDGFNGKKPETIAIISDGENYKVIHVAFLHENSDPKTIKSFNDGAIEYGLNYLLWPNKNPDTQDSLIFSMSTPQETDIKGDLLSDGGLIEFQFVNGKFVATYPEF